MYGRVLSPQYQLANDERNRRPWRRASTGSIAETNADASFIDLGAAFVEFNDALAIVLERLRTKARESTEAGEVTPEGAIDEAFADFARSTAGASEKVQAAANDALRQQLRSLKQIYEFKLETQRTSSEVEMQNRIVELSADHGDHKEVKLREELAAAKKVIQEREAEVERTRGETALAEGRQASAEAALFQEQREKERALAEQAAYAADLTQLLSEQEQKTRAVEDTLGKTREEMSAARRESDPSPTLRWLALLLCVSPAPCDGLLHAPLTPPAC